MDLFLLIMDIETILLKLIKDMISNIEMTVFHFKVTVFQTLDNQFIPNSHDPFPKVLLEIQLSS